ncbi:MAG: hypothetical protein GY719_07420 [bacterium]|nr:hypothetical protein [bacterium]
MSQVHNDSNDEMKYVVEDGEGENGGGISFDGGDPRERREPEPAGAKDLFFQDLARELSKDTERCCLDATIDESRVSEFYDLVLRLPAFREGNQENSLRQPSVENLGEIVELLAPRKSKKGFNVA